MALVLQHHEIYLGTKTLYTQHTPHAQQLLEQQVGRLEDILAASTRTDWRSKVEPRGRFYSGYSAFLLDSVCWVYMYICATPPTWETHGVLISESLAFRVFGRVFLDTLLHDLKELRFWRGTRAWGSSALFIRSPFYSCEKVKRVRNKCF